MDYSDYPNIVAEDIVRLRRRISSSDIPPKQMVHNLIIGIWNIKDFNQVYEHCDENRVARNVIYGQWHISQSGLNSLLIEVQNNWLGHVDLTRLCQIRLRVYPIK